MGRRTGPPSRGQGDRRGGRPLKQRVRTAAGRPAASTRWLQRQLNDPYVAEARSRGLRSRAAFKLIQLDERFRLLKPGQRIIDLGAAPGGWAQVAAQRVGSAEGRGRVVAIDLLEMAPVPGVERLRGDVLAPDAARRLREALGGPADLVLSDMAAPTTGHAATDHRRIMALAEEAFDLAQASLAPGGSFVCKLFQGGAERPLLERLRRAFATVRHAKPAASRSESAETYIVATGFRLDCTPLEHDIAEPEE